jgi:hypothetical protein
MADWSLIVHSHPGSFASASPLRIVVARISAALAKTCRWHFACVFSKTTDPEEQCGQNL